MLANASPPPAEIPPCYPRGMCHPDTPRPRGDRRASLSVRPFYLTSTRVTRLPSDVGSFRPEFALASSSSPVTGIVMGNVDICQLTVACSPPFFPRFLVCCCMGDSKDNDTMLGTSWVRVDFEDPHVLEQRRDHIRPSTS